ncbi:2-amino-4-hydroxy-6-hydroxymethyldihydropteridinediphosphokinase [Allopseudospirillum japonicum]|uniref:2-amino-4-hydroxy-6-hydroxymethyldihydropteridine diphosphokinase n=1 Tax=Allopseudospirillum japonicum TaxID=64971 RepID=A0A1H6RRD3_9GAMM|nr:2-amino-4-hydroxy-6-hydroxymethyldihydropteridine diphosphokinase [Allopseudospirillum japonicum]SEI57026.1 2-amino-4-hydroxy-6-hydroxymethyldihydropteridinediphosphokinase [Allopseudospirillum japonicum]
MTQVYLSLGTNLQPQHHLRCALDALHARFGELALSPVYQCAPVGVSGADFLNLVVGLHTQEAIFSLYSYTKAVEAYYRRTEPKHTKTYTRALDIDLLTYGETCAYQDGRQLPCKTILQYDFILRPLADLAPHEYLPGQDATYAQLWQTDAHPEQKLQQIDFHWQPAHLWPQDPQLIAYLAELTKAPVYT